MEIIREWILAVTVYAILIALADSLMPSGAVKKIGKITGGLILMLGILQPMVTMDIESLYRSVNELEGGTASNGAALQAESQALWKSFIEEQLNAYVLDKAKELGADVSVSVQCGSGEDHALCPESVTVMGTLTEKQRSSMTKFLENDLGIQAEKQKFANGDAP